jgi:hypothetical protein
MTLTIELTEKQEQQLQAAARLEGVDPAELAKKLVIERLPALSANGQDQDPTLALFAQWEQEDENMTPEEIEQERRLWEAFQSDINATRQAQGMRTL